MTRRALFLPAVMLLLIAVAWFFAWFVGSASAAEGQGRAALTAYPAIVRMQPGARVATMTLANTGDVPLTVTAAGDRDWLAVSPPRFVLEPGARQPVLVTVHAEDANPAGLEADRIVSFSAPAPGQSKGTGVQVRGGVGVVLDFGPSRSSPIPSSVGNNDVQLNPSAPWIAGLLLVTLFAWIRRRRRLHPRPISHEGMWR